MWRQKINELIKFPSKVIIFSILFPLFIFFLQQDLTNFFNQENERLSYSKKLIDLTEKRAYLAENFYSNSKQEPDFQHRKEKLWEGYAETLAEYNFNLVPSLIIVEKNYGLETQKFYHDEVFMRLRVINIEIAKIRTNESYDEGKLIDNFEILRNRKYRFAETLLNCEAKNLMSTFKFFIYKQIGGYHCKVF